MRASLHYRQRIVYFRFEVKLSLEQVRQAIQNEGLTISKRSIFAICKRYKNCKSLVDNKRSGRKPKLSQEHLEYLDETIAFNRQITIESLILLIKRKFSITVSKTLIINAAKKVKWSRKMTRFYKNFLIFSFHNSNIKILSNCLYKKCN